MKPERWKKVEKLFNAALELEPGRRTEFLADACKGDEALRAEVESLLEHGDQRGSFIESPAMKRIARDIASNSESNSVPLPIIGKTISHYKIVDKVGAGGMGVVYRARDTKLGRDVAVKVLPAEFARDPDRIARFQREAKVLASLNHSNIAAIYDLVESDGEQFLVQELIEGETLADRLKHGSIPVEESLELALQIIEALGVAHEKGIIHRDLKPSNIKITPERKVKVLDFGLARTIRSAVQGDDSSHASATKETITEPGVMLGTATYMSPEQVKGKPVDERTDIWAFGCVLYEMLVGKSPFAGEDFSQTLANVLERESDFSLLPRNIHPKIRETLERCLEKDPRNRWHDITDAGLDIRKVFNDEGRGLAKPGAIAILQMQPRTAASLIAAVVILSVMVIGFIVWNLGSIFRQESNQAIQFVHVPPENQYFRNNDSALIDISADGSKIVYVANGRLYLRNFSELTAKPIQGSDESPAMPFFSYDGKWIGYIAGLKLKKIPISGGTPETLCDGTIPTFGATWEEDDTILFGQFAGIMQIKGSGGNAELLIKTEQGEQVYGPKILPGGEWVLFTITNSRGSDRWETAQIVAQSLESGERKVLVSGGCDARYVPTGHLVYASGSELLAIAFDVDSLSVSGTAIPIVQDVERSTNTALTGGTANYGFSDGGMLAYVSGGAAASKRTLVWVDRKGNEEPLKAPPNPYSDPRISPDGTKLALTNLTEGNSDIWIWDLARKNMIRLTSHEASELLPTWTPDNRRILFSSSRNGWNDIFWKRADGTGDINSLFSEAGKALFSSDISKDGKTVVMTKHTLNVEAYNLVVSSIDENHTIKTLLDGEYNEFHPRISLDGQWLAYGSDESGQYEVYVRPFPDVNREKYKVSTNGGESPIWSRNGRELFYRNGSEVMMVSIKTKPVFRAQIPETLFHRRYFIQSGSQWDISPDGKRFLMIKESDSPRKIIIVTNWFEELKERVPVD
jgi:predicted Ser/Thr protein kinase